MDIDVNAKKNAGEIVVWREKNAGEIVMWRKKNSQYLIEMDSICLFPPNYNVML